MDIVTLDFETYWAQDYTLSKMTTEAYVRDPRFEPIMVGIKVNQAEPFWVPRDSIRMHLDSLELHRRAVLMHHAHFDGLILSHHYGIRPKLFLDTLGMGRALHGANGRLSLEKLAERYAIGVKGKEVHNVKGMRFADFSQQALARYGLYCCMDVELTYKLMLCMINEFARHELEMNDRVIRMFTEPSLVLDDALLGQYVQEIRAEKTSLMLQAGVQQTDLMSNDKFAQALIDLGVDPPKKMSPRTGKLTFAFAKTDFGMQALQEHPDERVQILVEARLKNKTTIAERSAERLIEMNQRGAATIYLKYSGAAGTHRLSAGDKINWQAMKRGGKVRKALKAPPGDAIVVGDSSNIEARLLDWLAGQEDMVEVYRRADRKEGPDMYCVIGGKIYKIEIVKGRSDEDDMKRQMGKVTKLGLGFGMGVEKFIITVRGQAKNEHGRPLVLEHGFAHYIVHEVYRAAHPHVVKLWRRCDAALECISKGIVDVAVDPRGLVRTCKDGIVMPGGLKILFPDLRRDKNDEGRWQWTFWNGKAREYIYGAKLTENIIQCLARIIVFAQCLETHKQTRQVSRWCHSVHDEGLFHTHMFEAPWVRDTLLTNMRIAPDWAEGLPLNSEGGFHERYGLAKK
jgi:DNA polymerase